MDILDIYNLFAKQIVDADIDLERLVLQYLRQCPPHQNDQGIAYIVLCHDEYRH